MAPAHPANTGAPWVGAGFSRPGTRKRSPLSGGQLPLSPSSIAFLPPASRRRPSGQPPAGGATGRALKGCPARTPALPGRSGPSGGGVPTESPGATLVTPLLLLGALGAEPGQRAELPPLSRRSPGAGRSRCLVPRPAPGTRSAIRSPAAPGECDGRRFAAAGAPRVWGSRLHPRCLRLLRRAPCASGRETNFPRIQRLGFLHH